MRKKTNSPRASHKAPRMRSKARKVSNTRKGGNALQRRAQSLRETLSGWIRLLGIIAVMVMLAKIHF